MTLVTSLTSLIGKTIQAVSLIMSDYPINKPSLIVVPPVALIQWSTEIAAYTDGKLKVLIHHNTDPKVKGLTAKDLKKYDIVMISYAGLESLHRKQTKGWKRDEGLVKENSRIHTIHWHRLILDEAHSMCSFHTQVSLIGLLTLTRHQIAKHRGSKGLLCTQSRLQVVPFRHPGTKQNWRVFLFASFSGGEAFRLVLLQDLFVCSPQLVPRRREEMHPLRP